MKINLMYNLHITLKMKILCFKDYWQNFLFFLENDTLNSYKVMGK